MRTLRVLTVKTDGDEAVRNLTSQPVIGMHLGGKS